MASRKSAIFITKLHCQYTHDALTQNSPTESKSQSKRTDEQIAEQRRSLRCDRVAHVCIGDLASAALE
jgi:hypothetical protein